MTESIQISEEKKGRRKGTGYLSIQEKQDVSTGSPHTDKLGCLPSSQGLLEALYQFLTEGPKNLVFIEARDPLPFPGQSWLGQKFKEKTVRFCSQEYKLKAGNTPVRITGHVQSYRAGSEVLVNTSKPHAVGNSGDPYQV